MPTSNDFSSSENVKDSPLKPTAMAQGIFEQQIAEALVDHGGTEQPVNLCLER
ncbi:MAG: hypothetical protein R2873_13205 [Caldilineaceae bacterium]